MSGRREGDRLRGLCRGGRSKMLMREGGEDGEVREIRFVRDLLGADGGSTLSGYKQNGGEDGT